MLADRLDRHEQNCIQLRKEDREDRHSFQERVEEGLSGLHTRINGLLIAAIIALASIAGALYSAVQGWI